MATFAINPTGLRVRPTYESLTNYIVNQPMIAYPERRATMIARSQKMSQLFNENAAEMAQQQAKAQQNLMMEKMTRGVAEGLMAKGFGKGSVGSSGFATGLATPGGTTQAINVPPPPQTQTTEAQTQITGPVEDRLDARVRRLLDEPGVPAPPIPTETIQTNPDKAIQATVEMVEGPNQQTRLSSYRGQARLGGRNLQSVITPSRLAELYPNEREVPLTDKQQAFVDLAHGVWPLMEDPPPRPRASSVPPVTPKAQPKSSPEASPTISPPTTTIPYVPPKLQFVDMSTPDATPRGLSVPADAATAVASDLAKMTEGIRQQEANSKSKLLALARASLPGPLTGITQSVSSSLRSIPTKVGEVIDTASDALDSAVDTLDSRLAGKKRLRK